MIERNEKMISHEIRKLVPIFGKENADRLNRAYLVGDEEVRKRIFELVDTTRAAVMSNEDLKGAVLTEPPPKDAFIKGELTLGHIIYGRKRMAPMRLSKDSLLMHMGIFGSSGYGKTNISYNLIETLSDQGLPVIVFDFSKRNYKDLISTRLKDRIDIYTIGRDVSPFRFNPLTPPPGVLTSQWIKEFSEIFDHAYWLLGGGRHVILKGLSVVFDGVTHPRLIDLKGQLYEHGNSNLPVRERNWLATAERPLESLCFKELGEVFDVDEGILPSDFFRPGRITILELDSLDTNDKSFFIEITLQWIRDWLLMQGEREKLRGVIILEEAHHILNREKARRLGSETVIDLIFREVRELGLGMVYLDQHPSMVSYPALGNTSNQIYLNLGLDTMHSSDVQDATNMLGIDYDDQGVHMRRLPVGNGFMICRASSFTHPFTIAFEKFDLEKGKVNDDDIRNLMKGRIPKKLLETVKEEEELNIPVNDISNDGWDIMRTIGEGKGVFASQIYKEINISGSSFKERVQRLISQGLVGMREAKISRNKMNYYYLTELGEKYFEARYGLSEKKHDLNIGKAKRMFENVGWAVKAEDSLIKLSKGSTQLEIVIEDCEDRNMLAASAKGRSRYFICADEVVKNLLLQHAAICASPKSGKAIFVTTLKGFEENGRFERIDFLPDKIFPEKEEDEGDEEEQEAERLGI
jgi:DNA-binding HxlR family transcriptional regulator